MVLVVTELATRYTADTTGFKAGAAEVKADLRATQEQAQTAATQMDAYWRSIGQTATAQQGVERLSGTVQGLQRQMQLLGEQHPDIRFTANGEAVAQQLTNLQTRLTELSGKPYSVELRANTALIKEDLARVQTQIREIQAQSISLNTGGATREVENLGGVLDHLSGVALPLVGLTAMEAFKQAADASVEWQTTLVELQNNTGVTTAQLNEMADTIRRVQSESNVNSATLAEATMHITNFGFRGAEATQVLEEAMKSASSTGGDTAKTAELLANAMHEYGNSAYTAQQAVDVLHVAAQVGVGTFEQFAEASGQAVGVAANLHVPLEQVTAAIAALTQHGYSADEATTQMVAALTHIINPAQEARGELDRLSKATGVDLVTDFSAAGLSSRGFTGVLDDLHLAYQKMGFTEEQATQQTMQLLNAQRGGLGVATLLGTGAKDYTNTLTLMAQAMSGQTTPTQDAFNRSVETTGYQMGILGNNLDILKTRLGDSVAQSSALTTALNTLNQALQGSNAGWKAVEAEPEKYAGALADMHAAVRALPAGNLIDAFLPKPEDLEKRAQEDRAAVQSELTQMQADIRAHNRNVDDAMAEGGAAVVEDVNKAWHDAQQAQLTTMHQMNDEAAILAMANADAVYDPHAKNVDRMANAGHDAGDAYLVELVNGSLTRMPAVDAYIHELEAKHDIAGLMGILGKNAAAAYITNLNMEIATGLAQTAAEMDDLHTGASRALAAHAAALKASAISFGQQMNVLPQTLGQAQQEMLTRQAAADKAAAEAAARKEKAAANAAASAAKHAQAQAKAAETAARQEVASTETVVKALEQAAQQTDGNAKGIGQSLVTLMNLLKAKIPPDMVFVRDAITNELKAAASDAPPTVQKLHDDVVGILHRLAGDSRQEVSLMATAALEQLSDFTTAATAKAEQAATKVDAQAVKLQQSMLKALGDLGTMTTADDSNIADFVVQAMDLAKQAADAKQPQLVAAVQGWIDAASSATPPKMADLRQSILGTLQTIAAGSDPLMAAWARSMITHIDSAVAEATKKLQDLQAQQNQAAATAASASITKQLEEQQAQRDLMDQMLETAKQQAEQMAQAQQQARQAGESLAQALAQAGQATMQTGQTSTNVLVQLLGAMQQATAAGMPQIAATIQGYLDQARAGGTVSMQDLHDTVIRLLQEMVQSSDQAVALYARQALEQMNTVTTQAAATASLAQYQAAQEAAQAAAQAASETYTRQQKVLQDLQKQLQDAQKAQQDFANAPLQGEHAANEAQFQNQQQQNQLQLQITRLQFEGAPRAQIESLQHQLDTVRQQGEMLRLQTSTTFDPLHHAIQEAVTDTKELTYQDAISGAVAQKKAVEDLQLQIATQTRVVDAAQAAQQRAQAAAQAASQAYQDQQRALQQLQQAQQQTLTQVAQMAQQMQAAGTQAQTTGTQVQTGMGQAATGVGQLNTAVATGVGQVLPAYTAMFAPTNDGTIFHMLFDHSEGFFTKVDQAITTAMDYTRLEVWTAQFTMLKQLVTDQMGKIRGEAANGGRQVGNALGEGIRAGIGDEVAAIAQEAAAAVTAAIQAAREAADAHSPSEESRKQVGAPIGQGIARGIRDTAAESAAAARAHVQGAITAGAGALAGTGGIGAAGGFGGTININNYLTAQLSMADLTNPAFWDGAIGRAISIALQRRGAMRQPNGAPA